MSDFDPINLHPYRPSAFLTLRQFHEAIVYIIDDVRGRALEKAKLDIGSDHPLYANIEDWLNKTSDGTEDWENYKQKQGWEIVWDELLGEKVVAYAFDDQFRMHKIGRDFWTSSYAASALSTGRIEKIALYVPNGTVYIEEKEALILFGWYEKSYIEMYNIEIKDCIDRYEEPPALVNFKAIVDKGFAKRRGRKTTYDVKLLLIEAARMLLIGDVPNSSHGSMKAWRSRLADAYIKARGDNDLPSDDTISRELSPIFRGVDKLLKPSEPQVAQIENRSN